MEIKGKHEGNLRLSSDVVIRGMVCGNLIVPNGVKAQVPGVVTKRITVETGGILILRGVASGGVTNNGGYIEIYGMVNGGLIENSGTTKVDPEAHIN